MNQIPTAASDAVYDVCTLCEGDYDLGVGALINSLAKAGFRGRVVVGYRGRPPRLPHGTSSAASGSKIDIECVPVDYPKHMTNFKPNFMREVFQKNMNTSRGVAYFDPDIILVCKWNFLEFWMESGVAACGDVNYLMMQPRHPKKLMWRDLAERCSLPFKEHFGYANAGFIGVARRHMAFVDDWIDVAEKLERVEAYDRNVFNRKDETHAFGAADQDVLNMVMHVTDSPIALVGHEGMGFSGGGASYMAHAIGPRKPWRRGFVLDALRRGARPSLAARAFWDNVAEPIRVVDARTERLAKLEIKAAVVLARLFG